MTPQAALDQIAALCAEGDVINNMVPVAFLREVLAEVTPEPDGDMQSPLAHLGDMQSFGPETCSSGVNLTSEEAALAVEALHIGQESLDDYADQFSDVDARLDEGKTRTAAAGMRALAARLEAAQ